MERYCETCNKKINKKVNESRKSYNVRRFCCMSCFAKCPIKIEKQRKSILTSYASGKIKPWNKGKKLHYEVWNKGEVGSKYAKEHGYGKWMTGKKTPLETRIKLSQALKGEKGAGWIDGRTPLNQKLRHSLEYKLWRTAVFEKDGYRCLWCGAKSGEMGKKIILQADHILRWADFPRLRFDVNNGQTLCYDCHKVKTDAERQKSDKLVFNYS